jgi:hypothetical protein
VRVTSSAHNWNHLKMIHSVWILVLQIIIVDLGWTWGLKSFFPSVGLTRWSGPFNPHQLPPSSLQIEGEGEGGGTGRDRENVGERYRRRKAEGGEWEKRLRNRRPEGKFEETVEEIERE